MRKLRALAWLMLAATLGVWAHGAARSEALARWLRANPPGTLVWDHALGALGFVPERNPARLQKVFRTLPAGIDDSGSVWITHDSQWIAVYRPGDPTAPGTVYCLACKGVPSAWEPAGTGWAGYLTALPKAEAAAAAQRKSAPRPAEYRDPREIRY